ncbi:ATP-binding protein [Streptomyces sp. NPDC057617]|uniref:ATP-binding protein n=1 Tax=Streptomyces sp. NPDC057617 TaxID=3346184 RepID=UPI0036A9C8F2
MVTIDMVGSLVGWLVSLCGDSGIQLVRNQRDERSLKKTMRRALATVVSQADPAVQNTLERGLVRFFASPPQLSLDGSSPVGEALQAAIAGQVAGLEEWVADTTGLPFADAVDMESAEFVEEVTVAVVAGLRQYAAAGELAELVRALDTAEIISRLQTLGLQISGLTVSARAAATFSLPRDVTAFTGRELELERIVRVADSMDPATAGIGIHAIDGMAGIGKTALSVHVAHALAPRFHDGQLFLHLHGHTPGQRPVDPADALASLLLVIGVPARRIPSDLQTRSALWRDRIRNKKMLLLLDDAVSSEQVRPLLPGSRDCLVLVTSRRRLTALEGVVPISLDTLAPPEATALFARLAARPGLLPSDPRVAEVVRLCGYLPLAIRLTAGKLAHHPSWSVQDLARDLAATQDRIVAMRAEDDSVTSALDLSYRDLTHEQQRMFRRIGLHPGSEIDAYIAAALDGTDFPVARELLDGIFIHHLIEEPGRGRYRMHDLVRQKARSLVSLDPVPDTEAALSRMLDYFLHTTVHAARFIAGRTPAVAPPPVERPPTSVPEISDTAQALGWLGEQRSNIHAVVEFAASRGHPAHAIHIAAALNDFLRGQGHWDQAITLHQCALRAATGMGDLAGQALALGNLGSMQRLRGDHSAALSSQRAAQEAHRESGDRLGEATATHELGVAQRLCSDYAADLANQERARELYRSLGNKLGEANTLHELGTMYWLVGDLRAALTVQTQALEIYRDLDSRYGMSFAHNELAVVLNHIGDHSTAASHIAHALNLLHDLGNRHGEAYSLKELGVVEYMTGDHRAAISTLSMSVDLHRDLGNRYGMGLALTELGIAHRLAGDLPTAITTLVQAVELHREFGYRYGEACTFKELGATKDLIGERVAAEADLTAASVTHSALGHRYGQADTLITQGELLARHSDLAGAHDKFTRGLGLAREIGAAPLEARALEAIGRAEEALRDR